MKVTKSDLREIILQEINELVPSDYNPGHVLNRYQTHVFTTEVNAILANMDQMAKEIQKNDFHKNTNDLMESSNTTLYNQRNENALDNEVFEEENDGPTLVFDDFDQSADLDVPAYIRKQNR